MNEARVQGERVQKLLAASGCGSRREIEQWIRDGRVTRNGRSVTLGDRAQPGDRLQIDGREIAITAASGPGRVLLYHKPVGEVSTRRDPEGRATVFDRLPPLAEGRWIAVGRLDAHTSGLMLFTDDGEIAHGLAHPSREIPRRYLVRVRGQPDAAVRARLLAGVPLDDGPARFDDLQVRGRSAGHAWFEVALHEGRNREVRRLWEAVGFEVSRLKRIAFGAAHLPEDLAPGTWRLATKALCEQLRDQAAPAALRRGRGPPQPGPGGI
ncbi:MAG: pseudouridine synthase [Steroidobacteraceae bacterium]